MAAFRETIFNQSGDVTKIQDGGRTCCVPNPRAPPRSAGMLAEMSKLKQQVAGLEETVRSLHEQLEVQSHSAAPRAS